MNHALKIAITQRNVVNFRTELAGITVPEANEALQTILFQAIRYTQFERSYVDMIQALMTAQPDVDVNSLSLYVLTNEEKVEFTDKQDVIKVKLPKYAVNDDNGYETKFYTQCTPLIIASLFNLQGIMAVLVKHPNIDPCKQAWADKLHRSTDDTAYSVADRFEFSKKQCIREAHMNQFIRETAGEAPSNLQALLDKHAPVKFTPKEIKSFILKQIDEETDKRKQVQMILNAKNDTLVAFMGNENGQLVEKLNAILTHLFNPPSSPNTATTSLSTVAYSPERIKAEVNNIIVDTLNKRIKSTSSGPK